MLIKSILLGCALEYGGLEKLQDEGIFTIYYEHVRFEVTGKLDLTIRRDGRFRVDWDLAKPFNRRNYEKAREQLAKTPVPRDVI